MDTKFRVERLIINLVWSSWRPVNGLTDIFCIMAVNGENAFFEFFAPILWVATMTDWKQGWAEEHQVL